MNETACQTLQKMRAHVVHNDGGKGMKVIIIGSGLSGLTAGAVLAQAGHEVAIFEQYHQVGGVTLLFERDGFHWDFGQLLVEGFGPQEPVGQILAELGLTDKIRLRPGDRGYVFPDFEIKKPAKFGGVRWQIEKLKELFPEEEKGLERYWQDYLRFTRLMTIARWMERASSLEKLALQAKLYATLLPFLPRMNWSAEKLMGSYFNSEKLKCVFISILADFFTPPSEFQGLGYSRSTPRPRLTAACRLSWRKGPASYSNTMCWAGSTTWYRPWLRRSGPAMAGFSQTAPWRASW